MRLQALSGHGEASGATSPNNGCPEEEFPRINLVEGSATGLLRFVAALDAIEMGLRADDQRVVDDRR